MRTGAEYRENERELLALYRQLPWKEQVRVIGRLSVTVERALAAMREVEPAVSDHKGKVIPFPAAVRV